MKVGIIGCRGIPNHHGGFEQFAEYFSVYLAQQGINVVVYNSSLHPYKEPFYKGVKIIKCNDPEDKFGTAGQFIYDLNCIMDARKRNFDIILQLGYTSNSIWHRLLPKKTKIVTNMDGLEWKRSKYGFLIKKFLKYAEKLAALNSDYLIADSVGIQQYLKRTYNKKSVFIAYGANIFKHPEKEILSRYNLKPNEYNVVLARIEPENNIDIIIEGVLDYKCPTIIIGDLDKTKFGNQLKNRYQHSKNIKFLGAIYDTKVLNNLRHYSKIYFHGHSVGGTNPSLLEAMASNAFIIANDNIFNKAILKDNALYFKNSDDIKNQLEKFENVDYEFFTKQNKYTVEKNYSWDEINLSYLNYFKKILNLKE